MGPSLLPPFPGHVSDLRPDPRSAYQIAASRPISIDDAHRLIKFEQWVASELSKTLIWPEDTARRQKLLGQAKAFIMEAVAEMGRRGFLFNGPKLAAMIRETLVTIRRRQDLGHVHDLYPYLRQTWTTYVGARAEELRQDSMSAGTHVAQLMAKLAPRELTIPELAAQQSREHASLREAKAAARKRTGNDSAPSLFDL
jgi:hypothetical protein